MHKAIQSQFFKALAWNGASYSFYKITNTLFTFILFQKFSTELFSAWALTHSIIFLVLLLLDGGLRKSIPYFVQQFSYSTYVHRLFILSTLAAQIVLLLFLGIPLIVIGSHYFFPLSLYNNFYWYLISIFLVEGVMSLLNTLYQAHFLQNIFGFIYIIALAAETIANFLVLYFYAGINQQDLLFIFFNNKIISRFIVIIISLAMAHKLTHQHKALIKKQSKPLLTRLFIDFGKHTLIMWATTLAKSLSERNFLLLLFTKLLGPVTANLFKISHDSTLLLQRIVIKTIGVSDTALLAQVQSHQPEKVQDAFLLLSKTIFRLIVPFVSIALLFVFYKTYSHQNSLAMLCIMLIFIISYCIEIILSPYERLLETNKLYSALAKSYAVYFVIFFGATLSFFCFKYCFIFYLLIVQASRVISSFLMRYYVQKLLI